MAYKWNRKYFIEDDYLSHEHFEWCAKFFQKSAGWPMLGRRRQGTVSKNKIFVGGKTKCKNEYIKSIYDKINIKALSYLKRLEPRRISKIKYSALNFVRLKSKATYHVHADLPKKLCSIVIYIAPKESTGTLLYKSRDDKSPYEVMWKPNRALIFCRHADTWHSYKNPHNEPRDCLIYNLIG